MRTGQKKLKVVTGESAEMKELRQDVPRVGNKLHRQKQQRKSKKKKEKQIMEELGMKMNGKEATSKS